MILEDWCNVDFDGRETYKLFSFFLENDGNPGKRSHSPSNPPFGKKSRLSTSDVDPTKVSLTNAIPYDSMLQDIESSQFSFYLLITHLPHIYFCTFSLNGSRKLK